VAEIKMGRKRSMLPWIIGLVLLLLVILVVSKTRSHARTMDEDRGAAAADALRDDTPPRLRQYAQGMGFEMFAETLGTPAILAA
jgi:hypothetical protein